MKTKKIKKMRDITRPNEKSKSSHNIKRTLSPHKTYLNMKENYNTNNITHVQCTPTEIAQLNKVVEWCEKLVTLKNHDTLGTDMYFACVNIPLSKEASRIFQSLFIGAAIYTGDKEEIVKAFRTATKTHSIDSFSFHILFFDFFKECYTMFQWQSRNKLINVKSKEWDFKNLHIPKKKLTIEQQIIRKMCSDTKWKATGMFIKFKDDIFLY